METTAPTPFAPAAVACGVVAPPSAGRGELFPLIAAGDREAAAQFFAAGMSEVEERRAADTLAAHAIRGPEELAWVESLLVVSHVLDRSRLIVLAQRLATTVDAALARGGRLPERRAILAAALVVLEPSVGSEEGTSVPPRVLAPVWGRLVEVLLAQRDIAALMHPLGRHREVSEASFRDTPDDPAAWAELANAHIVAGDVAGRIENDAGRAMECFRRAVAIAGRGGDGVNPGNAAAMRQVTRASVRLGEGLRAQGDLAGALATYRGALALAERGTVACPQNPDWQHELATCHTRMGDVMSGQQDHAGALLAHRQSLRLFERLYLENPDSVLWRREMAGSQLKIGDALLAQGNVDAALAAYRYATSVRRRLAEEAGGGELKHELWIAYGKMADAHEKAGSVEAGHWWRLAHDVLAALKPAGHFRAGLDDQFLVWLRQKAFADVAGPGH